MKYPLIINENNFIYNQLHAVSHTQQGGQRERTLVWDTRTKKRAYKIFHFLEWESKPQLVAFTVTHWPFYLYVLLNDSLKPDVVHKWHKRATVNSRKLNIKCFPFIWMKNLNKVIGSENNLFPWVGIEPATPTISIKLIVIHLQFRAVPHCATTAPNSQFLYKNKLFLIFYYHKMI